MENISNSTTKDNNLEGYEQWLDSLEAQRNPETAPRPERRLSLDGSKTADRIEKAAILDYANAIHPIAHGWEVESMSDRRRRYVVTQYAACDCPDFAYRHSVCKHILATFAPKVVWGIKWLRSCESIPEAMDRYALHRQLAIEAGTDPKYLELLDKEYRAVLIRLGDPFVSDDERPVPATDPFANF